MFYQPPFTTTTAMKTLRPLKNRKTKRMRSNLLAAVSKAKGRRLPVEIKTCTFGEVTNADEVRLGKATPVCTGCAMTALACLHDEKRFYDLMTEQVKERFNLSEILDIEWEVVNDVCSELVKSDEAVDIVTYFDHEFNCNKTARKIFNEVCANIVANGGMFVLPEKYAD